MDNFIKTNYRNKQKTKNQYIASFGSQRSIYMKESNLMQGKEKVLKKQRLYKERINRV